MKGKLAALAALVALYSLAMGQEPPKPYSASYENGLATFMLADVTKDAAWAATFKALAHIKHEIISAEKESGTITSRRKMPGALGTFNALRKVGIGSGKDTRKDEMPGFNLIFTEREGGVEILANIIEGEGQMPMGKKGSRKFAEALFNQLVTVLYGEAKAK